MRHTFWLGPSHQDELLVTSRIGGVIDMCSPNPADM